MVEAENFMNNQCRGRRYLPRLKAEADNTVARFDTSWYHAKTEFNNCFNHTFFKQSAKEDTLLEFAKVWEQRYTSEGLGNLAAFELDICSRYWVIIIGYHVNFTLHCILTECSRLFRVFIVRLAYNNWVCL